MPATSSHSISVIEGPPGTGKTETILNLIANAFSRL
ncbi:AAA domain-containing protein [Kribbella sp. NPDC049227]